MAPDGHPLGAPDDDWHLSPPFSWRNRLCGALTQTLGLLRKHVLRAASGFTAWMLSPLARRVVPVTPPDGEDSEGLHISEAKSHLAFSKWSSPRPATAATHD